MGPLFLQDRSSPAFVGRFRSEGHAPQSVTEFPFQSFLRHKKMTAGFSPVGIALH